MADRLHLAYLIGQYPAVNHGYLLEEVRHLRLAGIDVHTASVSLPDRPAGQMTADEREEVKRTFYLKGAGPGGALASVAGVFFTRPLAACRAFGYALSLAGGGSRSLLYHFFYFVEACILGRWMERHGIRHVHASFSVTVAEIACRLYGVGLSFGVYGYGELYNPRGWHLREKIAGAVFVRAISRHAQSQLMLSCDPAQWSKLATVYLGIDPLRFRARPFRADPSPFTMISVGRLAPEKACGLLLAAVARVAGQGRSVRLHLVGDGPERAALEEQAARGNLSDCIVFEGRVTQERLMHLYSVADAAVMTSLYEGIPMVLMEAMAMEIPCIAPCITGIPELLRDKVEGLLFTPTDEDMLVSAMTVLMDSPALRRTLGQAARQRIITCFDMSRNSALMAELFYERLQAVRPAPPLARAQQA